MAKHITEEQVDMLVERLLNRVDKANVYFLKSIGAYIKKIKELSPSKAQQLIQILKYGGDYDDIVRQLAKYTDLNVKDIDDIFNQYAKKDQMFYKQFYEHRNIPFVPYESSMLLQTQTKALANIVKNEMYNFTRQNILGYTINGTFHNLRETYNSLLDEALMNVGQGKETFDGAVRNILKDIGGSGLKTLDYESGRSIRLDSAIRMHLKGRLRELHNENQKIYGDEFGADGIEISVHSNPAPDHELVQGRQFSLSEYEKLNSGLEAKDYKGRSYTLDHDGKNGYRPISEMNCYHYIFSIVLGVSKPEYTDEQLNQIINENDKGFTLDGKHYTMYEGTQMQRALEREIRKNKDIQILARESDNKLLISESQNKISVLTNKYNELSQVSNLPKKMDRLTVSGYRRVNITKKETKLINLSQWQEHFKNKYGLSDFNIGNQKENKLHLASNLDKIDNDFLNDSLQQIEYLYDKYKLDDKGLRILLDESRNDVALARGETNIAFCKGAMATKSEIVERAKDNIEHNWWVKVKQGNESKYAVTHEIGHIIENRITHPMLSKISLKERGIVDQNIKELMMINVSKKTGLSFEKIQDKYFSNYAKSEKNFEWFAESFTQLELGEKNEWIEEFERWLKEQF